MIRPKHWTEWLVAAVAAITILSAVAQILFPDAALGAMGMQAAPETVYLFRLVSLFTGLFGGLLLHTALAGKFDPVILVWAGLQKLLGAAMLLFATVGGVIAPAALLVAAYDAAAGAYILWFGNFRR